VIAFRPWHRVCLPFAGIAYTQCFYAFFLIFERAREKKRVFNIERCNHL